MEIYNLSQTSDYIGIPQVGRTILYRILRAAKVVDFNNRPAQKYIDLGLLKAGNRWSLANKKGSRRFVALVVGNEGLDFIKMTVRNYLANNSVPRVKYFLRKRLITSI